MCCRDFGSDALEPNIELPHQRILKIVEPETMKCVKDEGNARKLCGPSAKYSGFWTMCVYENGTLPAKHAPHLDQSKNVFDWPDFTDQMRHPDTGHGRKTISPVHEKSLRTADQT